MIAYHVSIAKSQNFGRNFLLLRLNFAVFFQGCPAYCWRRL